MKRLILISCFVLINISLYSQKVTGVVTDSLTNEPLPGAVIIEAITGKQLSADANGRFAFVSKSKMEIKVTFVGYNSFHQGFKVYNDTNLKVKLSPIAKSLKEIQVLANGAQGPFNNQPTTYLNQSKITKIPSMLGESDMIKVLATSPGVKQLEGQQGFNVRGSSQDQNLILYDEAIIYNCSHLLGFYSVFNTNAIQNVSFFKTGIPARYGGRLASAMIVEGNGGSLTEWKNRISVGLLASNVSFSGPIVKNKCSFSVSGRRSYIDKLILPFVNKYLDKSVSVYKNGYFFQDYNAKIIMKPNAKNKIELSGYWGDDEFMLSNQKNNLTNNITWGNRALSLKWRNTINDQLSESHSLSYSYNDFHYTVRQEMYYMNMSTKIRTLRFKSDWLYVQDGNPLRFGVEALNHYFLPNDIDAQVKEFSLAFGTNNTLHALENAAYLEYPCQIGTRISLTSGIRISEMIQLGPFVQYFKNSFGELVDSLSYPANKDVKVYWIPEPRLIATYTIDDNSSVKMSATYNAQYLHLVPILSTALPTDMWLPSMNGVKPQKSLQISGGYYRTTPTRNFSIDAYIKRMYDVSDAAGTMINFYNSGNIGNVVVQGDGLSFGLELGYEKLEGRFTYGLSYTLSRSLRRFDAFNNGDIFPAKYDKPHDLSIVASYELSKRWTVSGLFTYSSGVNITMPVARYLLQNNIINLYGSKNGYRLPAYHRADISFKYLVSMNSKCKTDLEISVSNVYNHLNPYYIYYNISGSIQDYKLSVEMQKVYLFPILPSITYNILF